MGKHSAPGDRDSDGRIGNRDPDKRGRDADPEKNARDRKDIGQPDKGAGRHRKNG